MDKLNLPLPLKTKIYNNILKLISVKEAEAYMKEVTIKVTSEFSGTDLLPNISVYIVRKDMD